MLKILLLTGDAGEAQEIYYAKYRLEEEGWEVRIAALKKRAFLSVVRHFVETGKPIAATCHGPLLVLATGLAKGRTLTCYPDLEPDVRAGGGVFVNRDVVVDGTLVTVRGWPDNGPWMREFVRLLKRTYPQVIGANRTVTD